MSKKEFVKAIAEKTGLTQKDITVMVDALPEVIKCAVINDEKINLTGFLSFEKKHVGEKTGTVMLGDKKGETWVSPAHDEITVKLSKSYKML